MTTRRPLALGAAAVIGFGSLFIAAPAIAAPTSAFGNIAPTNAELDIPQAVTQDVTGEEEVVAQAEAAAITSVAEGERFEVADAPTTFSGTGEPGDEFDFRLYETTNYAVDESVPVTVDESGEWSVDVAYEVVEGLYTAAISRPLDGGGSAEEGHVNFRVSDDPDAILPLEVTTPDASIDEYITVQAPYDASGSGEPGATVDVSLVSDSDFSFEATADVFTDGRWNSGPFVDDGYLPVGDYTLTVQQTAGEEVSDPVVIEFSVVDAPFELVDIDGFDEWGVYTGPVTTASGVGEPGATLELISSFYDPIAGEEIIREEYTDVQVGEDGTWSVELDTPLSGSGEGYFNASQYIDGEYVHGDAVSFQLADALVVGSPENGASYAADEAPTGASGAATYFVDWEEEELASSVTATLTSADGTEQTFESPVTAEGTWAVDFEGALAIGDYTLTVSQHFAEADVEETNFTSAVESSFSVVDPGSEEEEDENGEGGSGGNEDENGSGGDEDENGQGGSGGGQGEDELSNTGGSSMMSYAAGAGLLLVGGAAALAAARRRANEA